MKTLFINTLIFIALILALVIRRRRFRVSTFTPDVREIRYAHREITSIYILKYGVGHTSQRYQYR